MSVEPTTTDWQSAELAERFDELEGLTERTVGFPLLFAELGLEAGGVTRLLDYGCGPGNTAREVADAYGVSVTGVDSSAEMLRLAAERPHPRVDYRLLDEDRLAFLDEGSIDAAMSCFVLINVPEVAELQRIAAAVHRVLRPGARYVVMDSNPAATGIRFASFQTGERGRAYEPGAPRHVELYGTGDDVVELTDYHWPSTTYRDVLAEAGFVRIRLLRPRATPAQVQRIAALTGNAAPPERDYAPLLLAVGEK